MEALPNIPDQLFSFLFLIRFVVQAEAMATKTSEGYVKTFRDKGITQIEFFHPGSNSLPGPILETLARQIREAGQNPESRVIILRSAGEKAFCAGASFEELMAIRNEQEGLQFFSGFANVLNAMRTCPKFILARIQGKCVGGGVGLAAAADYAIAREDAAVRLSELALGIGPFVVGPAVKRKIGVAAFCELSMDAGSWRDAGWSWQKGLYAEVHPTMQLLDAALEKLAAVLSEYSPEAMAQMKRIWWEGTENWDQLLADRAAISGRLVLSNATRTYIRNFKQRSAK
jgi:methylglutaconyl-CoA hydratase